MICVLCHKPFPVADVCIYPGPNAEKLRARNNELERDKETLIKAIHQLNNIIDHEEGSAGE